MKSLHTLLVVVVLVASFFVVAGVVADEAHAQKHIKLALGGGDITTVDVSDLEEGETYQEFVGDKELLITNTGDDLRIEIDGEEINLGNLGDHHVEIHGEDGDHSQVITSTHSKIIVKHLGEGEGDAHGFHFISSDGEEVDFDFDIDMDGDHTWVSADGERRVMVLRDGLMGGGTAAAEHLEASGVLDDLDSAKKEEILEALRSVSGPQVEVDGKVVVIRKGEDEGVH